MSVIFSIKSAGIAALASVLLSSCALVSAPKPAPDTYDISAPRQFAGLRNRTHAQILVKEPTALKAVDSQQIMLKPSASEIAYLSGAQWSDRAPKLIQAKLVETFENTRRVGAVAKPGDGLVIDYQLVMDVRRFEIASNGGDRGQFEMSVKLLDDKSGVVLETKIFEASVLATGSSNAAYVAALDRAFDKVARDIVEWVFRRV